MGSSSPQAPNPFMDAMLQGNLNSQSAIEQNMLNDVNQITPYGSVQYKQTGSTQVPGMFGSQWIPQMTATTSLSPELQKLVDTNIGNNQGVANAESGLIKGVLNNYSKPLDLGWSSNAAQLGGVAANQVQPMINQQDQALQDRLYASGNMPGSANYNYANTQQGLQDSNTMNNLFLQGQGQAAQQQLAEYNQPLNALTALETGSQVSQPGVGQLAPTSQASIQSPNYMADNMALYQQQSTNANAQNGMLGSLLGSLGGMGGGLLGRGILSSDRNDKTDIQKLDPGDMEHGIAPTYAYRYKGDPANTPKVVGPMAQDIEKIDPSAVSEIGGHKVIVGSGRGFGIGPRGPAQRFGVRGATGARGFGIGARRAA